MKNKHYPFCSINTLTLSKKRFHNSSHLLHTSITVPAGIYAQSPQQRKEKAGKAHRKTLSNCRNLKHPETSSFLRFLYIYPMNRYKGKYKFLATDHAIDCLLFENTLPKVAVYSKLTTKLDGIQPMHILEQTVPPSPITYSST